MHFHDRDTSLFQLRNLTIQDIATQSLEPIIQREIPNYLYALGVCLYLMPYQSIFVHAAHKIFFELWSIATVGNTLRLPVPSMLAYGDQFLKSLLSHDSDLKSLEKDERTYFIQLSTMICQYLVRRQPERAASYMEPIVKSFPKLEAIAVENDPQMEVLYTFALLSLGEVAMYKDRDMERAEGYFLKIISQTPLTDNNSSPDWSIKKRWMEISAYSDLLELYMNEEKRLDRKQTIKEAARDTFKKYTELISTFSSNEMETLALGYVPAALVEWAMASPRDPQISSLLSLSEQRAKTSGLVKVAPVLGEASRLLENGRTVEARQILLEAVSQAMSAEDKEAEYPCQLKLAIMAAQEGNTAAADLHLHRLKIVEEELHGGLYMPMSSLRVVSVAEASAFETNM
jgi:tetratricopeptide (TPR) repeat protein